jgi:hypothetical protein
LRHSTTDEEISMTATATAYDETTASAGRSRLLHRIIAGAAPFDAAMGVACLALADRFGRWLSVGSAPMVATGAVFLAAAAAGAWTLRRGAADVRPVVTANAAFALWCVVVLAADGPNALGYVLLAGAALTSGATAVVEHRLSAT